MNDCNWQDLDESIDMHEVRGRTDNWPIVETAVGTGIRNLANTEEPVPGICTLQLQYWYPVLVQVPVPGYNRYPTTSYISPILLYRESQFSFTTF